jgi:hypothetical protein
MFPEQADLAAENRTEEAKNAQKKPPANLLPDI